MNNTPEEFAKFSTVMWGTAEDFGGKLSKEGLRMRFRALQEFSIDQITAAGTWLLKNRKEKFPAVPTTREFVDAIAQIENGCDNKVLAEKQCDIVLKYLGAYGRHCDHVFKHPITRYLMESRWSFYQLGNMNANDIRWWRKDFVLAFEDMSKDTTVAENLLPGSPGAGGAISANRLKLLMNPK